jgi:MarR family transcriptional regulator, transcriptional regulator for hemolysin
MDLKEKELPLGRILSRTGRSYYGALINRLASSGLDRHFSVLLVIEQDFPNTSQKEIAARLGLDKAMITRMINFLMKKKYITRKPNLDDKREYCISLTPLGKQKIPLIRKGIRELNLQCRKGISEDAWNSFHETIFRLHENLAEIPSSNLIVQYRRPKTINGK